LKAGEPTSCIVGYPIRWWFGSDNPPHHAQTIRNGMVAVDDVESVK
jgi:hypothetical protein